MSNFKSGVAGAPLRSYFLQRPVAKEDLNTMVSSAQVACEDFLNPLWSVHCVDCSDFDCFPILQNVPAALIFTADAAMLPWEWLEYGMFLQSLRVASNALGLAGVLIEDLDDCEASLRQVLGIPGQKLLIGAMAVGHLDPEGPSEPPSNSTKSVVIRYLS